MLSTWLLGISIVLQFAAAFLALRLIPLTGRRSAWILIAAAVLLMGVRRSITFYRIMVGDHVNTPDLTAEAVALVISILMVTGLYLVAPMFRRADSQQRQLQESDERIRRIFESVRDVYFEVALDGTILEISPAVSQWGYTRDELIGSSVLKLHEDPSRREATLAEMKQKSYLSEREVRLLAKNGEVIEALINSVLVRNSKGEPVASMGSMRDVTEKNKNFREKNRLQRALNETQRFESLGRLSGGIAHDFNNMLTSIIGYGDLAEQGDLGTSERQYVRYMLASARRAAEMCQQLLTFAGRNNEHVEAVDINAIVQEVSTMVGVSTRTDYPLELDLDEGTPILSGEPSQVAQIALNLILNAIDASEKGQSVRVRTGHVERLNNASDKALFRSWLDSEENLVYLEVSDRGHGIPPKDLASVLEPFYTTKEDGHGLGLAAVTGVCKSLKGAIRVESISGEGTTFTIYLPSASVELAAKRKDDSRVIVGSLRGVRVLMAEDEQMVRSYVTDVLTSAGAQVTTVEDGEQLIGAFSPDEFDVVLTDYSMPKCDGVQAALALRSCSGERIVPIILMSGNLGDDVVGRARSIQSLSMVRKPIGVKELVRTIERVT